MFLLARVPAAQDAVFTLLENGVLKIGFHLAEHLTTVRVLMEKYRDIPMSLADACVVRMAELSDRHRIFTLDTDFAIYRKHGREPLPLLIPDRRE